MADRLPRPSTFSTDEAGWTEALNRLLREPELETLWLSLESKPLTLCAKPYRLRFDKRTIYLYELQQPPIQRDLPELARVCLPEPEIGHYYQHTTETGETWLCVKFRLFRDGDSTNDREMFAQLVIATCEEFAAAPPSDIPRQLVQ